MSKVDKQFTPIEFVGIRYNKLDHLIQNVNPEVVALQREYFDRILSDDHAKAIIKAEEKKQRQHYVDIEHDKTKGKFTLSVNKFSLYELLLQLKPNIDKNRVLGTAKEFFGKKKLVWQYNLSEKEFEPLFHQLSQHGRIESTQYNALKQHFTQLKDTPTFTPAFQTRYSLRQKRAVGYDSMGHARFENEQVRNRVKY